MVKIKFILDYQDHVVGDVVLVTANEAWGLVEWDKAVVLEANLPELDQPVAPKAKPAKGKK
jgi:hypothetical protein